MAKCQDVQRKLKSLDVEASQIADTRPISCCAFSPDSKVLVTGSWSGLCKLWSVPDCKEMLVMRGHQVLGNPFFKTVCENLDRLKNYRLMLATLFSILKQHFNWMPQSHVWHLVQWMELSSSGAWMMRNL